MTRRSAAHPDPFQARIADWMQICFGAEISADRIERCDRLLEEVFELLQSGDYPPERIAALEAYTWSRPKGEPAQEVGGVMVTLAAYCQAFGLDMHRSAEVEYARISHPATVARIRAKQAAKPTGSALPVAPSRRSEGHVLAAAAEAMAEAIRARQETYVAAGGFALDDEVIEKMERDALAAFEAARAASPEPEAEPATTEASAHTDFAELLPEGVEMWMVADALAGMSRSHGLTAFQKTNARLAERALRVAMRRAPDPAGASGTDARVAAAARLVARSIDSDMTAFNALIAAAGAQPETPVRHLFAQILEDFAALMAGEAAGAEAETHREAEAG